MTGIRQIKEFLTAAEPAMFELLERMVLTRSHSHDKPGNDRMAEIVAAQFATDAFQTESIEQETRGNHLVVRSMACRDFSKQVLLTGHMDTVFPLDSDFDWYREDGHLVRGPGVIDMKGGLVAGIFALKALESAGLLKDMPVAFLFNSDEEIGSRTSEPVIRKEARKSVFAFVLECGGLQGEIVTGRKGNMSILLETSGKAGHAASAVKDKASAILELAWKIIAVESLNDPEKKISTNAGKIEGGIGPNTVPDKAWARIDVRYEHPSDRIELERKFMEIAETAHVPGTSSRLKIVSGRPPMPQCAENKALFEIVKTVAEQTGIDVREEFRFGVSDANLIADENTPVLDGLGPVGADDHSENEYMIKKSLKERTLLLAASLDACWKKHAGSVSRLRT